MDKGDYISIIHLNDVNNNKESAWSFNAALPPPFGRQTSQAVKNYNKTLFSKQFPDTNSSGTEDHIHTYQLVV